VVADRLRVSADVGTNAPLKVGALVAGMVAGADCIDDMELLRHGALAATFAGVRAPSTLGSFLRALDHGNVRQLGAVHREVLAGRRLEVNWGVGKNAVSTPRRGGLGFARCRFLRLGRTRHP
jgi:hypothetical protein